MIASASTAHAIPYETQIDVDSESDLQDLLSMQEITQDTFDELVDLLSAGVDLNTADRAELYTLPNLTYDVVDKIIAYRDKMGGYIKDPAELVTSGALTSEKLLSISAFLIVRPPGENPLIAHGFAIGMTRYGLHDNRVPPFGLRARVTALRHLTAGIAATTTRLWVGDPLYDPNRDALVADAPSYRF